MDLSVVKKRISEVLAVDSINSSQADFLATHVPFRKITLQNDPKEKSVQELISEEEVFERIFNDQNRDKHQLVIVEGESGAGKSHFIRWLNAKLYDKENELVILIKRSDNTLKGTIRQLLERDEIKSISNKDIYDRLVKANQTMSEQKFRFTIYHNFIVEIENDNRENIFSTMDKKRLIALLSNELFQKRMLESGGPIDRIYNKIVASDVVSNEDSIAQFKKEDFTINIDFQEEMQDKGADKKALKMANKLIDEDDNETIAQVTFYMNSFIDYVIRSCVGIEPGDFEYIFKAIRQELKKQNRTLILLIEDITSFTGINSELLNVLVTGHTGLNANDNLCRLISVVGTTTEYYKTFRSNYIDRITSQITINDGTIGESKDDLVQFFARYLNAMSLEADVLSQWMHNGADDSELPIYQDLKNEKWDHYTLNDKRISLYPFTKCAINSLFNEMEGFKTPRAVIREIIEPAVFEIIERPKDFPMFCREWRSSMEKDIGRENIINRIGKFADSLPLATNLKSDYKSKLKTVIGFWGNGTLNISSGNKLSGLDQSIFNELGISDFYTFIVGKSDKGNALTDVKVDTVFDNNMTDIPDNADPRVNVIDAEREKREEAYRLYREAVLNWHNNNEQKLKGIQDVRDAICNFVFETLNWQQYGIPTALMRICKESANKLFAFERQDQAMDRAYIILEDNEETYNLLICFGRWVYLGKKSWNFKDSPSYIYFLTLWLENNKERILEAVHGQLENNIPVFIKTTMISELYRRVLNGTIGTSKLSGIGKNTFLDKFERKNSTITVDSGHSKEWCDLLALMYSDTKSEEYNSILNRYFNILMGAEKDSKKLIFNNTLFNKTIKELKDSNYLVDFEANYERDSKIRVKKESREYCQKILQKAEQVARAEYDKGKEVVLKIFSYYEYDMDMELDASDVKNVLDKIADFYNDAVSSGIRPQKDKALDLKRHVESIVNATHKVQFDYNSKSILEILLAFADNPIGELNRFCQLLESTEEDVKRVSKLKNEELKDLQRKGRWTDSVDPRFKQEETEFRKICDCLKGV